MDVVFSLEPAAGVAAAAEETEVAAGIVEDIDVPGMVRILRQGISESFERRTP